MFKWVRITAGLDGPETSLQIRGYEVARLGQRVDGVWLASIARQLSGGRGRTRVCTSYEAGRAGCEMWAQRHQEALAAWAAAQHAEWVASQRWRGS